MNGQGNPISSVLPIHCNFQLGWTTWPMKSSLSSQWREEGEAAVAAANLVVISWTWSGGTTLGVQWLRLWVRSLVWELRSHMSWGDKPVHSNCWAHMPQLNHPWSLDLGCCLFPHDQASLYLPVHAGTQVIVLIQGSQQIPRVLQHSCWKPGFCSLFWGANPCHKSRSTPTSQGCGSELLCLLASCMAVILDNSYSPPRFQGDTRVSPCSPAGLPGTESGSRVTSLGSPSLHLPSVGMSTGTHVGKGCLCSTQVGTCWQVHCTGIELWCPKHTAHFWALHPQGLGEPRVPQKREMDQGRSSTTWRWERWRQTAVEPDDLKPQYRERSRRVKSTRSSAWAFPFPWWLNRNVYIILYTSLLFFKENFDRFGGRKKNKISV